jgi:hypothetical protein
MSFTDQTRVDNLALSVRLSEVLKDQGLETVGQARRLSDQELLQIPNFERDTLNELRKYEPKSPAEIDAERKAIVAHLNATYGRRRDVLKRRLTTLQAEIDGLIEAERLELVERLARVR